MRCKPALLLIGTDCPALDAGRLRAAAQTLADHGATMQPAHDGGYVLLGLTRWHASLFDGIAWSSPEVAAATRARFAVLGWPLYEGEALHDIDEPADLRHVPAALLASHGGAVRPELVEGPGGAPLDRPRAIGNTSSARTVGVSPSRQGTQ